MAYKRFYVCDADSAGPVLTSLVAGLGETGTRIVSVFDLVKGQALCHVLATKHSTLAEDSRVRLLPDASLDIRWSAILTRKDREQLNRELLQRGFRLLIGRSSLYKATLAEIGGQLDSSFEVLNFSA